MTLGPLTGITLALMKDCVRLCQEFSGSSAEPEREAPERPSPLKARLETKQNPVEKQTNKQKNSLIIQQRRNAETVFYYLNEGGVPQTRSQLNCCSIKALQGAL